MAEELQHLIERIQREAVDTGEQKAAQLVGQAREQAAGLLRDAEAQAKALIQKAEQDARQYAERSEHTLKQAARDLLISVGQGVEQIFARLALDSAGAALAGDSLKEMLARMVGAYATAGSGPMEVLLSSQDQEKLLAYFQERFREEMKQGLTLCGDERLARGFQVSLEGGRVKHQFTPEAIAEALSHFLRPKLAAIVYQVAREAGGVKA